MKALGFDRASDEGGVEFYMHSGSVYGLLAARHVLEDWDLAKTPESLGDARRPEGAVESQMIQEATMKSLADIGGLQGGE